MLKRAAAVVAVEENRITLLVVVMVIPQKVDQGAIEVQVHQVKVLRALAHVVAQMIVWGQEVVHIVIPLMGISVIVNFA
ncbi:hypothetical protein [Acinetobacter sp.]|uniref:hypothetical protein n=1 Tax=Acinetobacter sp. TaxID=472 RepID=UPI0031D55788